MKAMWKKVVRIVCAGGLSVLCLAGCGKDTADSSKMSTQEIQQNNVVDEVQENNNATDDGASGSMGDGEFYDGANLQGNVVEFSDEGFSLSPAITEDVEGGGEILVQTLPGLEDDENNVQITYTDDTVFQIVTISKSLGSELSREDTDKESVKKQSSVAVFGSCQDTYHWTADKILIFRYQ